MTVEGQIIDVKNASFNDTNKKRERKVFIKIITK